MRQAGAGEQLEDREEVLVPGRLEEQGELVVGEPVDGA
jgi:hypothetical protein